MQKLPLLKAFLKDWALYSLYITSCFGYTPYMAAELQRAIIEGGLRENQTGLFEVKALVSVPEKMIFLNLQTGFNLRLFRENRKLVHTMGVEAGKHNTVQLVPHYPPELVEYVQELKPRIVWLEDERVFKRDLANSFDPAQKLINQYLAMYFDPGTSFNERWNDLPTLSSDNLKG